MKRWPQYLFNLFLSLQACKKSGGNVNCTATKAAAENIGIFPADNAWNTDISQATVDPYNTQIIAALSTYGCKADFGAGLWEGAPIGIPYAIPVDAPIEGNGEGDAHVIAVDKENKILYELYNAGVNGNHWEVSSGAIYNLNSNTLRYEGWTSADAAGLPIFAALVRYEEVLKGEIDHAIRFTLSKPNAKPAYIAHPPPATGGIMMNCSN